MIDPESLQQFLETLPDVTPTVWDVVLLSLGQHRHLADLFLLQVPDELTQHYLKVHGFDCSDIRM